MNKPIVPNFKEFVNEYSNSNIKLTWAFLRRTMLIAYQYGYIAGHKDCRNETIKKLSDFNEESIEFDFEET